MHSTVYMYHYVSPWKLKLHAESLCLASAVVLNMCFFSTAICNLSAEDRAHIFLQYPTSLVNARKDGVILRVLDNLLRCELRKNEEDEGEKIDKSYERIRSRTCASTLTTGRVFCFRRHN